MNAPVKIDFSSEQFKILDETKCSWDPREIIHVVLKPVLNLDKLEFEIDKIDTTAYGQDIKRYIADLPVTGLPFRSETPFDIVLKARPGHQVYVLIELSQPHEWCFTEGTWGMTAQKDYGDDNFGLEWLDGKLASHSSRIVGEDCRYLWLRIRRRGEGEHQYFNYHVTFKQGAKRMPVIFDPDVRNDGGSFP